MSAGATDFEALLREALAPVEPPTDLAQRLETDAGQPDRARAGGARGVGALDDARPAQLGPPGGRGGRRRRAPARRSSCCGSAAAHRSRRQQSAQPARARRAHAPGLRRGGAAGPPRPLSAPARRARRRAAAGPLIASAAMAVCYRHPSRETGVSCSSCGRPICPDCMTPTPVGMRCPECSRERTKVQDDPQRADACRSSPRR